MEKPLKILFVSRSGAFFGAHGSIIRALLERGHYVRYLFDERWTNDAEKKSALKELDDLKKKYNTFEYGIALRRNDTWRKILFHTREILSYRSYLLEPRKNLCKYFQNRWLGYLPATLRKALNYNLPQKILASSFSELMLRAFERMAPADKKICKDILKYQPDIVVASPVNMRFSSADLEYLKAAKYLKIPTVLQVYSWDNLTDKGLFHIFPDRLLVWNEDAKQEALSHHHIPERLIRIIGAPVFDKWYSGFTPSQTRSEFCEKYGLKEDPIILYLGSSFNITRDESWMIEEIRRFLDSDSELAKTQIIIRPHSANKVVYRRLHLHDVLVLPKDGQVLNSQEALQFFYDTLYFAAATIGVNTSGMIDALIAGKPGMVFITPTYEDTQLKTAHFRQLFNSGALECVKSGEEFVEAFKKLLAGEDERKEKRESFVRYFVRPNGFEKSAGECAADEIEKLSSNAYN